MRKDNTSGKDNPLPSWTIGLTAEQFSRIKKIKDHNANLRKWLGLLRDALDVALTDQPRVSDRIAGTLPHNWWDKTKELVDQSID